MSTKQAYVDKIQARLNEWDAEIEQLKARAAHAGAAARIASERQLDMLREEQREAQAKLDDLRAAGDDAWQDMKTGVEQAWSSLEEAARSAKARFAA